jgi:hypothetical protein
MIIDFHCFFFFGLTELFNDLQNDVVAGHFVLLCFGCTFSATLHRLHTYRNFDLRLLTYLSTSEKSFPTHPMLDSLLIPFVHAV